MGPSHANISINIFIEYVSLLLLIILTASELYHEEFRKKDYCGLDRNLFIQKPIDNEDLVKQINKTIKK